MYPVNIAKLWLISLFLASDQSVTKYCKALETIDNKLPMAVSIFNGQWTVAIKEILYFSVVCDHRKDQVETETIIIKPLLNKLSILGGI